MKILTGEIIENKKYGENLFKIEVFSPYICRNAAPGQFINVRCNSGVVFDPLLRRPFSIYEIDKNFNVFSILYIVRGKGTNYLAGLKKGDILSFIGPLGQSFKADKSYNNYLIVGGGIGVAPLCLIAKKIIEEGKKVFFIAGFKDAVFYIWERDIIKILRDYKIFTEDGSFGEKGLPTDYIKDNLQNFLDNKLVCCGPREMLVSLQEIAKRNKISADVLMEERMACGIGVCMGCAVKICSQDGNIEYKKVCSDGPIFNLMEVVFDQ
ncbi:MAG: dihydroorotate dehydrogenase electron transfer subunit [Actinobacteria bacterium]|nr:dihydroorotate dehydrogenase electron transfer subunit [Actinomycetota bacterium]MBM3712609.1 dihydroorotate dehydrogenase electron transfer subunit [Actinomycetota bacterium]